MIKNFKVLVFLVVVCFLPLKLPAADVDSSIAISMDFQDASLKDILKVFSIQSRLNFIASEAVQDRQITLFLDKVSIKEAMDKLFKANNLTYDLDEKSRIFIVKDWGKPTIETVTRVFYLKYATVSSSSLQEEIASKTDSGADGGASGGGSSGSSVKWAPESEVGITKVIKKNLTASGSITEDYRTNSLIITDVPSRMPVIEELIASLDVSVPQIMLEVEMLDVNKNVVDRMGFSFDNNNPITLLMPGAHFNDTAKFFIGKASLRGAEEINSTSQGSVVWGNIYAQVLDFLRTRTDTKFLARPRLLTLNNETAEIYITKDEVIGREDTQTTTSGVITTTSTFKRSTDLSLTKEGTGIFLRVTPQINLERNEVTMVINPKSSVSSISTLSTTTNQQADVEVRTTKSVVKVKDGETVIVGGILHNEKQVILTKLPLLGDIPFIGALFRHKNQTKNIERELLVFITPRIIKDANIELAKGKGAPLTAGEKIAPAPGRQLAIEASLNNFEKIK